MTQEDKELLLRDLRGRLPYSNLPNFTIGVFKWKDDEPVKRAIDGTLYDRLYLQLCVYNTDNMSFKPYLRPMSSMTEDEVNQYYKIRTGEDRNKPLGELDAELFDFYHKNHIDYRGLIPKGLAIEVTEENNPYK